MGPSLFLRVAMLALRRMTKTPGSKIKPCVRSAAPILNLKCGQKPEREALAAATDALYDVGTRTLLVAGRVIYSAIPPLLRSAMTFACRRFASSSNANVTGASGGPTNHGAADLPPFWHNYLLRRVMRVSQVGDI